MQDCNEVREPLLLGRSQWTGMLNLVERHREQQVTMTETQRRLTIDGGLRDKSTDFLKLYDRWTIDPMRDDVLRFSSLLLTS